MKRTETRLLLAALSLSLTPALAPPAGAQAIGYDVVLVGGGVSGAAQTGAAGGGYRGPGDSVPPGAGGGASGPAPGGSAPSAPPPPSGGGPTRAAGTPGAVAPGPSVVRWATVNPVGPEAWWTWWQLHKQDFLRPNLLRNWVRVVTGLSGGEGAPDAALARLRAELLPDLREGLSDGDARVRAAAALALGRLAGGAALGDLLPLLSDPGRDVRERTLLALGASADPRAAEALLAIAATGRLPENGARVGADARPLAVFALAVGRRAGLGPDVDHRVAALARGLGARDEPELQAAILMYQTVAPCAELEGWTLERARDPRAPLTVRARALETLRTRDGDDRALLALLGALEDSNLELRRSAALALGELAHPLAPARLIAAAEREREPMTRGFALLSLGRQGGDAAREHLVAFLADGPKSMRPWTALALGVLAREDDPQARAALRAGLARERSQHAVGAFHLALGIARDPDAEPLLIEALRAGKTPESRAVAAIGLAMLGTPEGAEALRARFAAERNPLTRAEIAQALGFVGDPRDVPALRDALCSSSNQDLRLSAATALGLHGTREGLEALIEVALERGVTPAVRATAIEALQIVLGGQPSLTIPELLRQSNFSVFPPLLVRLIQAPV